MALSLNLRRPNRDYSTHIAWNYDLNRDLYEAYIASEPEKRGFTSRLKVLWDSKHPEFRSCTAKHLNQQAKRVIKNRLVYAEDNGLIAAQSDSAFVAVVASNCPPKVAHDDINILHQDSQPCSAELRRLWDDNLTKFRQMEIRDRPFSTTVRKYAPADVLRSLDSLAAIEIRKLESESQIPSFSALNELIYTCAVTAQVHMGDSRKENLKKKPPKPSWLIHLEERITSLRRKISQVTVVLNCKNSGQFTRHQQQLKEKVKKWFGNGKVRTLEYKLCVLKQDLKALSEKLKYKKVQNARKSMNRLFHANPKAVYREWRGDCINVRRTPSKEEIEMFWKSTWDQKSNYKECRQWLGELESNYCKNAKQKEYRFTEDALHQALNKLQNNKSPGPDLIVGYWFKNLHFYRATLLRLLNACFNAEQDIPDWLAVARTRLLPKNNETHRAENYRPIACQNIMYKLYTAILHSFLQDHCEASHVITTEQAGGKSNVWGCLEQLLINKMVLEEAVSNRRDLYTVWLDYQKAFDSIPHEWLLKSLRLAKVPEKVVCAIERLTTIWATRLVLIAETNTIESDVITYSKGVFQGDSLSVLLFVLAINPLSFLLQSRNGYLCGAPNERVIPFNHLFFVDDLKLFSSTIDQMKLLLDVVTTFSKGIGMTFGQSKCAFMKIKRGKFVASRESLNINNLSIRPLNEGESYKYLGLDEAVSFNGPLNKATISKEYFARVRKVWSSELSALNKCLAHNTFAVPLLTQTFGILDWNADELEKLDVKTRKILTYTGNFHINGDCDRLYVPRKDGGRGLKSVYTSFQSRIVAIRQYLHQASVRNPFLAQVEKHEQDRIVRIANEITRQAGISYCPDANPRMATQSFTAAINRARKSAFTNKITHGYLTRQLEENQNIDVDLSLSWQRSCRMSSYFEGYAYAIQEQEIATKSLMQRRNYGSVNSNMCRLCKYRVEDISHIICGCEKMSSRFYIPLRHDPACNVLWNEVRRFNNPDPQSSTKQWFQSDATEKVDKDGDGFEYWWNIPIKTSAKVKHNRPDMVIWNHKDKCCTVVEVSCPLDVNVLQKESEKEHIYGPLMRGMQLMYADYTFAFVPIIIGATGYVSKNLTSNIMELGFDKNEAIKIVRKLQIQTIAGTVKIAKTFLKFRL